MRWLFLLLLILNATQFIWYNRQLPEVSTELRLGAVQVVAAPQQELKLLAEAPVKALAAGGGLAVEQSAPGCLLLGGFESAERAGLLEQRLLSLDIAARVVSTDASLGSDHWVYIPPLASQQASLRQLRELQARKIDGYLITEGELANGILLGVFPQLDSAVSVAEKLRAAGYEPQVRELPRIYQEYWVRIAEKNQRLVDGDLLARLAGDFSDLKHQLIQCSGVAHH
ncbi:SPOR domain-containing protein [Pseudomonas sp. MAP12]|uniref:SPOR domain-containing protein n=1 Tax=Geopseudomonas aromaticivorans TaxID=2849492 RepID=A0ABS6N124_9GAMM|nr:SPOR domain-containing protein [Pseudomonas aromaticivorans]MBV2134758.1 SPOR domain-containing protein [Pseudomonas aromaticivorans]